MNLPEQFVLSEENHLTVTACVSDPDTQRSIFFVLRTSMSCMCNCHAYFRSNHLVRISVGHVVSVVTRSHYIRLYILRASFAENTLTGGGSGSPITAQKSVPGHVKSLQCAISGLIVWTV